MRIAAFNVENLFDRAKVMNQESWAEGKEILTAYSKLQGLIGKDQYTAADKAKIVQGLKDLGLSKSDDSKFVTLRQNKGNLVKRPKTGPIEIVADGREDWVGWLELKKEAVDEIATQNTARVLNEVNADIVGVVEAENRVSLCRFNEQVLHPLSNRKYGHILLVDGNDERGIDVGLLVKGEHDIVSVRSHVDDADGNGKTIFSRDCPEYEVKLASGKTLWVLVNHLKSKGYGSQSDSNAKRKAQAKRVREIYDVRRATGAKFVAILGDLNDTPDSDPLSPLLGAGSDLKDISEHTKFQDDGHPGTYKNGTASGKIDYILLSPDLFSKVTAAGTFRKGVWGNKAGDRWPIFPEMKKEHQAASDHAALWADINI